MAYAGKTSTLTGTFKNGTPTGATVSAGGQALASSNFRATVLSGSGVAAAGIYSLDVVLPTASTVGLTVTPIGMGGNAVAGTFTARVRPASEAYQVPAAIPLGLFLHAAAPAGYYVESWPGFERNHLGPNQSLAVTVDGQAVTAQQDSESHWSNGNVRCARTIWRLPAGLAAGAEKRATVAVVNTPPNRTGWITPAAIVAAHDWRFGASGGELAATVLTASLRDIVNNFPKDTWGDNPMGGWDLFANGPLQVGIRAWRYVDAWRKLTIYLTANSDGTFDVRGRVTQPNYNGPAIAGAANQTRMVCAFEVFQDGTRLHAWGGPNDPRVATIPATALTSGNVFAFGTIGSGQGQCMTFAPAAGGTLPSGITAGTPYWLGYGNGGYNLFTTREQVGSNGTPVVFGTAGSGNVVVTPMISTHCFGGSLLLGTDGRGIPVGFSRVDIGVAWDEDYLSRGARLFPCYDKADPRYPSLTAGTPYYPQMTPWGFWLNTTGDNPGDNRIGYLNHNACQAYLNPYDAGFQQQMRSDAAAWADQPIWVEDTSGGRVLVADNGLDDAGGRYPGMGLTRQGKSFNGYQSSPDPSVSYGGGPNNGGYFDGYSQAQIEGSHLPCPWPVAALMTGDPVFADMGVVQANTVQLYHNEVQTRGIRTYYNIISVGQQLRGAGWLLRAYGFAEAFTATALPEAALIKHSLDTTADWAAHTVLDSDPSYLNVGLAGHVNRESGGGDVGFFFAIFCMALGMEVLRGDRPALRTYAAAIGNVQIGVLNDASPTGGTGYIADTNYHPRVIANNGNGDPYPSLRAAIASEGDFGNVSPPYPAAGFKYNAFAGVSAFNSGNYCTLARCGLALAKSAGIISLNGDDAGLVFDALDARIAGTAAGLHFSSPNWGGSYGGAPKAYPVFSFVPG